MIYAKRNQGLHQLRGTIPLWKLAEHLGISENTLIRWLRYDLLEEREVRIKAAIAELKSGQSRRGTL